MAKILIDSRDDIITYWDRKHELTFIVADYEGGDSVSGRCHGCDASGFMKCEEIRCMPGERKDRKHKIFKYAGKISKPRIISFFENLKEEQRRDRHVYEDDDEDDFLFSSDDDFLFESVPKQKIDDDFLFESVPKQKIDDDFLFESTPKEEEFLW